MNKYIKFIKLGLLIGIFASCTTFEDIDAGLKNLYGKNINLLLAKIGYPNGQNEVAGRKLYIWDSRETISYATNVTSYGTYGGTTTTLVPIVTTYYCTIIVEVDRNETIVAAQFEGNIEGCEKYAAAFRE